MLTRVDIESGSIELLEKNTLLLTYKNNYYVGIEDAFQIKDAFETLCPKGDIFCIVNLRRQFLNISSEAQHFLAKTSPVLPRVKGTAFVLNNLPSRLIIRFFVNQSIYPTKVFKDIEGAKEWLKSLGASITN